MLIATPTNWFFISLWTLNRNPSSGSLVISETGSLDRTKSSGEKRKKGTLDDEPRVSDRVEVTRVNPNVLIDEIWKDTKLDQLAESAESECWDEVHDSYAININKSWLFYSIWSAVIYSAGWHRLAGRTRGQVECASGRLQAGGHAGSKIVASTCLFRKMY